MGQDYTKHNLLFISKYPEIIHEFTDAMKDRDIEIETAQNGIEAAAKIKKKNYDVVITGLSLEGIQRGADHNVSEQDGTQYCVYYLYDHNQFGTAPFLYQRAECVPCIFTSGRLPWSILGGA